MVRGGVAIFRCRAGDSNRALEAPQWMFDAATCCRAQLAPRAIRRLSCALLYELRDLIQTVERTASRPVLQAEHLIPHAEGGAHATQDSKDSERAADTACGILTHSSLAVTTEGLPLGLAATKFWTREKFRGTHALEKHINPTRVPIEEKESVRWLDKLRQSTALLADPSRCVHLGDRESDIYGLFCAALDCGTHFLLRTCVDRLAGDGTYTIEAAMDEVRCRGLHRVEVQNRRREVCEAVQELRFRRIRVLPPIGKQNRYPELELTVLHATERDKPRDREPINWKLITDLPISSRADAIEKLHWYALRWKIETFHKILKSGCRAEQSKLRTAERLVNLLATSCILGWRIFWLTMLNRAQPEAPASPGIHEA